MGCKGRGSAVAVAGLVLVALMVHSEAATYIVGGRGGWGFNNMAEWPTSKHFKAGDVLVFNYNSKYHNVVAVSKGGYTGCTTLGASRTLQTGKDRVRLTRGTNYFICSIPGHCRSGMKMAIKAL